jgi:hypothetical protein
LLFDHLAELSVREKAFERASEQSRQAVDLRGVLLAHDPSNMERRYALATSNRRSARIALVRDDGAARKYAEDALRLHTEAAALNPKNVEFQRGLADAFWVQTNALKSSPTEAMEFAKELVKLRRKLAGHGFASRLDLGKALVLQATIAGGYGR